ncbi:mitotic spindle assembly checkpoint protein MAD2B-like [Colias croceus]|uniref:mitotic spindle assembly checkpoint protein MAD2B-like n=1 Tax=Colias crocea TaxID=72248 RepID=UPI001E280C10|nr:mitotic spindle assembly checkpoint protein MAD2B-like [Colias croceus]
MDSCVSDIILEFLGVAFHNVLYYASVYPRSIFETRKKYSVVVYRSMHPEVNEYIDLCLKSAAECLKSGQLKRVEIVITSNKHEPLMKFVFDLDKNDFFDETCDAYLVQAEQNMRAFVLNLTTLSDKFKSLPEDRSFMILLFTNESAAVAMATNPDLEEFPMIEMNKMVEFERILPIRRFGLRNVSIDSYVELT